VAGDVLAEHALGRRRGVSDDAAAADHGHVVAGEDQGAKVTFALLRLQFAEQLGTVQGGAGLIGQAAQHWVQLGQVLGRAPHDQHRAPHITSRIR
jgi:hypothetical protein